MLYHWFKYNSQFPLNSRIIYDLNDYNMNFQIIQENQNQDGQKNDSNSPNNIFTDFFSTFPQKTNVYSQNLKFGNSKGSVKLMINVLILLLIMKLI